MNRIHFLFKFENASNMIVTIVYLVLVTSRRQSKTETELKIAKDKINHHKMTFGQARRKVDEIIQSAVTFPSDNLGKPY